MEKSKAWDATLKSLVRIEPYAIDHLLLADATFVAELSGDIPSIQRIADVIHEVTYHRQRMILHIEFQTYHDASMPDRLLMYNVLLTQTYKLPVLSCVLYLLQDGQAHSSPLRYKLPDGGPLLTFHFRSVELGKLDAQDLTKLGDETLLALVPLTRNGTQRKVIESIFDELERRKAQSGDIERLSEIELITFHLTSFALEQKKKTVDLEWLKRRFRDMFEALEDTVIYKEMTKIAEERGLERGLKRGLESGLEQGLEKGLEQGRIDASRRSLQLFVQSRFSALTALAQEKVSQINDLEVLDVMIVRIGSAQTEEEARAILQSTKNHTAE